MRIDAIDPDELAVVPLDASAARDPVVTGAKAANLARAAAEGLPVLPGFVLVPAALAPGAPTGAEALRRAWEALLGSTGPTDPPTDPPAGDGGRDGARDGENGPVGGALVVRSSSTHEDTAESSMAGRFDSVLDVRGWDAFTDAVRTVLDSASRVQDLWQPPASGRDGAGLPSGTAGMAVLVQPMLRATSGGVMFGADPVEGRFDRILVSGVVGGPDQLVDGSTQGVRYQLTRRGRLLHTEPAVPRADQPFGRRRLAELVRLARRAERVYGGPQDIEFGFGADGRLWLFQARPITAMAARPPRGARLLGPGPVAETLPGVLQPLEEDLWLAPMAHGLTLALDIAGAASRRELRTLPVATTVDGRAAADLRLLGVTPPAHPVLHFINPAPGARRAGAAWRVGRLRSALPLLAQDLMADVDRQLHDFEQPRRMLSGQLLNAVSWGRGALSALHAQESLAGALLSQDTGSTGAGEALAVLAEGRGRGASDAELIAHHPVLLTLLPPTLGERGPLPERVGWNGVPRGVGFLTVREGLRLRIRWVQEMQTAMVREVGSRMDVYCLVGERRKIALLRWSELLSVGEGGGRPADLAERTPRPDTPPLPAAFRLADGRPLAVSLARGRSGEGQGQGAGGGRGAGTAWDGEGARPENAVLVVRSLDPALAPLLPGLSGLVAETGSVLSHLAVLAREHHVPTVVSVPDALGRFGPGISLVVDGGSGSVEAQETEESQESGPGGGPGGSSGKGPGGGIPGKGPGDVPDDLSDDDLSGDGVSPGDAGRRDEPRKGAVA